MKEIFKQAFFYNLFWKNKNFKYKFVIFKIHFKNIYAIIYFLFKSLNSKLYNYYCQFKPDFDPQYS